jgi:hypothetical protein
MGDLNDALKESYISKVGDALIPYTAELTAAGFNPTPRATELGGAGQLIETAGKATKAANVAAAAALKSEQDLRNGKYTLATATISLVEGALGKEHPLPVKLRGLRAELIGHQNPGGTAARPASTP